MLRDTADIGQKFCRLDIETVKMVVIIEAAFGNDRAFRSQLGYLILLMDEEGEANFVHYAGNHWKCVTR